MLAFLTELFELGLGCSALNTARSAISVVMQSDQEKTVGAHPKVVRFMKGVYELRTPMPRYQHTWDVQIVLNHFKTLEQNEDVPKRSDEKIECFAFFGHCSESSNSTQEKVKLRTCS